MSVTETHFFPELYEESVQKLGPQSWAQAKLGGQYTREIPGWDRTAKYKAAWAADLVLILGRIGGGKIGFKTVADLMSIFITITNF